MAVRPRRPQYGPLPEEDPNALPSGGSRIPPPPQPPGGSEGPIEAMGGSGPVPPPAVPPPVAAPEESVMTEGGKWNANYEWEGDDRPTMAPGNVGRLEGFNTAGWGSGERGTNSLKNTFGQMASNFDSDQGVDGLMGNEQFRAAFPNATKVGGGKGDLIDFDGPGPEPPVDVIRGAGAAGSAWAWQPGGDQGGGGTEKLPLDAMDPSGLPNDLIAALAEGGGSGDVLAQIQKELDALMNGRGSELDQEALQRELR